MPLDPTRTRQHLTAGDFRRLFIEELGWDSHTASLDIPIDGQTFTLATVAQKRGMVAFHCRASGQQAIPDYPARRKIDRQLTKSAQEHLIIYTDPSNSTQVWQWVKREVGKPTACREHTYYRNQPGDALIQKLQGIVFSLEEEEQLSLVEVTSRARAAFDVERVTKRFYDTFQKEHTAFLKFLKGIPDEDLQRWYASVMLNRLMFVYFIQKKGFLDGNRDYLRNKLTECQIRGKDRFYKDVLCPLFFEGFNKKDTDRAVAVNRLLGKVPYLNGGLFLRHQIEEQHGKDIQVADAAFEKIFDFFGEWQWHLDERPLRADKEINPDVLGYIFEKYINQKQMGAYYTKEDITGYISQNTVVPFLFDTARQKCKIAFEGTQSIWRLLPLDPDRYIYEPVKKGVGLELPPAIAAGLTDVSKRTEWNKAAPTDHALPTEIWREVITRRARYQEVRKKIADGELRDINDLITYNLDIRQFAQDVIENSEGPELLRAFYHAIEKVTVLDPTCGSGAFLFAALNILEPLYEACLDRMEVFLDELARPGAKYRPEKFGDFRKILERVASHPNRRYFVLKSIILNNLYGVDIMEEAVEICKLRLFLKLVAQVEKVEQIEPLPDIDFNIRAGNTLVGYASLEDLKTSMEGDWVRLQSLPTIEENAEIADRAFQKFHEMQTEHGMEAKDFSEAKRELQRRLKTLEDELNRYLFNEYRVDASKRTPYAKWLASHRPFHWFIEFYGIMKSGGFDVIIGNPPYVVYSETKVDYGIEPQRYETLPTKNLYAFVFERSVDLAKKNSPVGLIVQLTVLSSERLPPLQDLLMARGGIYSLAFPRRPQSIFEGVEMPVAIVVSMPGLSETFSSCRVMRFYAEERDHALSIASLTTHSVRLDGHRIAKIGSSIEEHVYEQVLTNRMLLDSLTRKDSKWILYYQEACRYWVKACEGLPFFRKNGVKMVPPHGRLVYFENEKAVAFASCLANSSLFYWFYSAFSDCEHINDSLIRGFHIPSNWQDTDWSKMSELVSKSIKENANRKTISTSQGHTIEYDEIEAVYSKPIIDGIDRVLAKHYGFTDEELDFIINYDIKYRMGQDSGEDEE